MFRLLVIHFLVLLPFVLAIAGLLCWLYRSIDKEFDNRDKR